MNLIRRLAKLILRRIRAKKLGLDFERCAKFSMPKKIFIDGTSLDLFFPDEDCVKTAFIDIFLDDCYMLEKWPRSLRQVLDIGAHIGLFSLAASRRFPRAVIHAYEPNCKLEPYLRAQAEGAGFKYFLEAIGSEDGRVSLKMHEDSVQTTCRIDENGSIPQVAFRKAINRLGNHIDLVKLDCEGTEWELFQDKEAWKHIKRLSMEYHLVGPKKAQEIRNIVINLGFRILRHVPTANHYGLIMACRADEI